MGKGTLLTRRQVLAGAAGAVAAGVLGGTSAVARGGAAAGGGLALGNPLWKEAWKHGLVYGSSTATWQLSDPRYARVFDREAAILFTEDDLLWYRLKPTPGADLDFTYGDQIVAFAEQRGQLVLGAHLVWDEGFGDGWKDDDLWGLSERQARRLLYGVVEQEVRHYRGRIPIWICVNEAIDGYDRPGLRHDVPWFATIGPEYVAESFHVAHEADPDAFLLINEFGFETDNQYGDRAAGKRQATLTVLDQLLADDVPVHGLGIQGHLLADHFADRFHARAYRRFLREVADRGLTILITEVDVLDDGLPADIQVRDRAVADVYARFLDVALDEPAVASLITFGLSDRYTWLGEDYPRDDGAGRRPLPFNQNLEPKRAYAALDSALDHAAERTPTWTPPRAR